MSTIDNASDKVESAGRDGAFSDESSSRSVPASSWDPYEVWRTRVKQPREEAARRLSASQLVTA